MKQQYSLAILLGLLSMTLGFAIFANPTQPKNAETVVASWTVDNTKKTNMNVSERLSKAAWHIDQSQYPGQANKHYSRANALLNTFMSDDLTVNQDATLSKAQQVELYYLWARVLQHQHQFNLAEQALNQAQHIHQKQNTNVTLLKANVQLAQGEFNKAKSTCAELLGEAQLVTIAACTVEVTAQQGQLHESYQQMTTLLSRQPTFSNTSMDNWLLQIVSDVALQLGSFEEAQKWLEKGLTEGQSLHQKPLSFVVLWADVQLALEQHQAVLVTLADIVNTAEFMDDALLSRLAIAETNTSQNHWQSLFKQRVELRIARNDLYHAADLARYYIYVQPSAQEAFRWASINWQQAKLSDDKMLLEKAKAM